MAKVEYWALLKKSWNDFRKNLVLVVPILVNIALLIGFILVLLLEFLVFLLILSKNILQNPGLLLSPIGILLLVVFGLLDILVILLVNSYVESMTIGMLKDVMLYSKTSVKKMFVHGKSYFERYFKLNIAVSLMFVAPILLLAGIVALGFMANNAAGIVLAVFSAVLLLAYFIFLGFFLFFIDPIFATQDKSAVGIIKSSFEYTRRNFGHVFSTWGVSVSITIVVAFVFLALRFFLDVAAESSIMASPALLILLGLAYITIGIANSIVNVIISLVLRLFQFHSYFTKNDLYRKK